MIAYLADMGLTGSIDFLQVNEEASDKVLEIEQKYNEIRRPVYVKRSDIIKTIPDFWLTAVSYHVIVLIIAIQTNSW